MIVAAWMARSFERVYECSLPSILSVLSKKMATWHMRGLTPVVTMLWASVSKRTGSKPLPAMLPTRTVAQFHPYKEVGLV
jgi:hypothetical protein